MNWQGKITFAVKKYIDSSIKIEVEVEGELAIDKRKFLLNRLYEKQPIPQDQD